MPRSLKLKCVVRTCLCQYLKSVELGFLNIFIRSDWCTSSKGAHKIYVSRFMQVLDAFYFDECWAEVYRKQCGKVKDIVLLSVVVECINNWSLTEFFGFFWWCFTKISGRIYVYWYEGIRWTEALLVFPATRVLYSMSLDIIRIVLALVIKIDNLLRWT